MSVECGELKGKRRAVMNKLWYIHTKKKGLQKISPQLNSVAMQ